MARLLDGRRRNIEPRIIRGFLLRKFHDYGIWLCLYPRLQGYQPKRPVFQSQIGTPLLSDRTQSGTGRGVSRELLYHSCGEFSDACRSVCNVGVINRDSHPFRLPPPPPP